MNRGWMLAADLDAWVRLLALHDIDELTGAEPDTMRFRLYHLPARLATAADGCGSSGPGPGRPRSPPAGSG